MSNHTDYQDGYQANLRQNKRIASVPKMSADQLSDALANTEYCAQGVPIGQGAADDRQFRSAIEKEINRRYGPE